MDPNLIHLIDDKIKWIFVGGKGGVGKTTTSCALGVSLAEKRENVLIISTDPAHNLSDSFDQKFGPQPALVRGYNNLYAMEIDPEHAISSVTSPTTEGDITKLSSLGGGMFKDLMGALPGIDEAMSFAKVMELVNNMKYSVVIFDTAPTGHTLRLLSFPLLLEKTVKRFSEMKNTLFPLLKQFGSLLGNDFNIEEMLNKVEQMIPLVKKVSCQLRDHTATTFVCVCIAEFLSMYETERLVQQLCEMEINVDSIVVNQLVECNEESKQCKLCSSRCKSQGNYLEQMMEMYDQYHLVKCYLLPYEVRGLESIINYSRFLF